MVWLEKMTDAERVVVLKSLIKSDMEPIELLIKMVMIVEPQSAREGIILNKYETDYVI